MVRTDQQSLKHILVQPLTTPAQQNWAAKLLGYDFEVVYKEGVNNKAADVLFRRDEETVLTAVSAPQWRDWAASRAAVRTDGELAKIISDL